ncbi:MAG: hypothetical protein ACLFU0_11050 [Alphaproteobacteria bacterium]
MRPPAGRHQGPGGAPAAALNAGLTRTDTAIGVGVGAVAGKVVAG